MELVSGGQDPVDRLEKFKARHPEIDIMTPLDTRSPFWKGYIDGRQLTVQHRLDAFLDVLEVLSERNEL